MSDSPLELPATPRRVRLAARAASLSAPAIDRALEIACATPDARAWRRFLARSLALFGSGLLLAGVVCFVAYNWTRLGRFGKFALLEAAILGATLVGWRRLPGLAGQLAIASAAVLVGPLLALFGQTYQTGADPYGLFLGWLIVIIPWVLVARFDLLWVFALVLLDTAVTLFSVQVLGTGAPGSALRAPLMIGGAHALAIIAWEWQRGWPTPWFDGGWAPRTVAAVGFTAMWMVASAFVISDSEAGTEGIAGLLALPVAIGGAFHYYRRVRPDRFMVAAAVGTGMAFAAVVVGRILFATFDVEVPTFFLMAAFVIWEITLGISWFRRSRPDPASDG